MEGTGWPSSVAHIHAIGSKLHVCRAEYDRLTETSPTITDDIISQFKSKFSDYEVAKPSICNGLDRCIVYKINPNSPVPAELLEPEPEPEPEPESEP